MPKILINYFNHIHIGRLIYLQDLILKKRIVDTLKLKIKKSIKNKDLNVKELVNSSLRKLINRFLIKKLKD